MSRPDLEIAKFFKNFFGTNVRVGCEGGVETVDKTHQMIHRGDLFSAGHIFESVSDNSSRYILFKADEGVEIHLVLSATTRGNARFYIYEDPQLTTNGTPLTISSHNRRMIKPSQAQVWHTPTFSNKGDQINGTHLVAGGSGNQAVGASTRLFNNELVLDSEKFYLFEIENRAGNNSTIAGYATYYIERL